MALRLHCITLLFALHYIAFCIAIALRCLALGCSTAQYIQTNIHTYIHYIALHYITLRYVTLHNITLPYITLHTLRYHTVHCITLHYHTVHCITLHYSTVHCIHVHMFWMLGSQKISCV